jgi:hypothetical protein
VILAELGSTPYNIMLLVHVLLVIVAFGAQFLNPPIYRLAAREGAGGSVARAQALATTRVAIPALLVAGLLGFGLSGLSKIPGTDELQYQLSQVWLSAAVLIWLGQAALYFFAIVPAMRKVGAGDETAAGRIGMFTGILHLSLVVMLWLMIWKPGL